MIPNIYENLMSVTGECQQYYKQRVSVQSREQKLAIHAVILHIFNAETRRWT